VAHSVFTIVADVKPESLPVLERVLDEIKRADGNDPRLPFSALGGLHFASFVIFEEEDKPPLLVFEHVVDVSIKAHLRALVDRCDAGIDAVYENCVGYPTQATPIEKLRYLRKRVRRPQLHHIGSAYRSVRSIKQDADLRERMEKAVDGLVASNGASKALTIWRHLQQTFAEDAKRPREPKLLELLKNWSLLALVLVAACALVKLLWSHPAYLFAATTLAFTVDGAAIGILVGWPAKGWTWKTALAILLPGLAIGAFLGVWPSRPAAALWTGAMVLGVLLLAGLARLLSATAVKESRGNWRLVPFVLLAVGASWAVLLALGAGRWGITLWGAIAFWSALIVIAALAFPALVFVSTLRRLPFSTLILLLAAVGGALALAYHLAARYWLGGGTPWFAVVFFVLVLVVGAGALWVHKLPVPSAGNIRPTNEHMRILTAQEDEGIQNHMSVMVRLRSDFPGRAWLQSSYFHILNRVLYRTVLPDVDKSRLFGIPTVHFAHWTVLEEGRHMFLSNYDFSWGAYLDDFGFKLGNGLQLVWGQSEGSPGTSKLESFKAFARAKAAPYRVWYRAYPGLTALQIRNNEQLRLGLASRANEKTSSQLLRQLAGLEEA
jgi:hypothetical protein